jgi:hypothetical protein
MYTNLNFKIMKNCNLLNILIIVCIMFACNKEELQNSNETSTTSPALKSSSSWLWAKSVGGSSGDVVKSVGTTSSGDVVAVGYFASSSITFGSIALTNTTSGTNNIFVTKYDSSGNVLWAKSAGGSADDYAVSVSVDNSGNFYVAGAFKSSSITFGSTTLTNSNPPYGELFIVKYDSNGNVLWAQKGANSTSSDGISSVSVDSTGNVYATGHFQSTSITFGSTTLTNNNAPNQDVFIVKYDASGNVLWAKSFGGTSNEIGNTLATDASGNLFISGIFASSSITIGSTTLTNAYSGTNDAFFAKYDASGNVLWAKSAGSSADDYSVSVSVDNSGNSFIAGAFKSSSITFGSTTLTNSNPPYGELFIVKYDSNGNVLWAQKGANSTSSDGISSVSVDSTGNVYATGHFQSTSITFGSTTLTNNNASNQDVFIVKYDASGNVLWAKSFGGTSNEIGNTLATDASGNLFIGGLFSSSSIAIGSTTLTNAYSGNNDFFIAKLSK